MATQTPQQGASGSESSRMMGALSNMPTAETQLQQRHHLVDRDAADAATENMVLDAPLKIVRQTGSRKNQKQHPIGCEYTHFEVDSHQLMIYYTAGVCRELRD